MLISLLLVIFLIVISPSLLPNLFESFSQNAQNKKLEQSTTQPTVNENNDTLFTETENAIAITLTPTVQLTNTSEPSNPITEIIGNSVYLRAGPNVYHPEISDHLSRGEEVEILARNESGDWFLVLTTGNLEG